MSIYSRIKDLASEKNISIRELESQLNFSNGTIRQWKDSTKSSSLEKVADYFNVSTDYLLGRTKSPTKTLDDEINEALDASVGTDGKPITDNDRAIIKGMIEAYIKNKG